MRDCRVGGGIKCRWIITLRSSQLLKPSSSRLRVSVSTHLNIPQANNRTAVTIACSSAAYARAHHVDIAWPRAWPPVASPPTRTYTPQQTQGVSTIATRPICTRSPHYINRPRGVTVSTMNSESRDRGSIPREAFVTQTHVILVMNIRIYCTSHAFPLIYATYTCAKRTCSKPTSCTLPPLWELQVRVTMALTLTFQQQWPHVHKIHMPTFTWTMIKLI